MVISEVGEGIDGRMHKKWRKQLGRPGRGETNAATASAASNERADATASRRSIVNLYAQIQTRPE